MASEAPPPPAIELALEQATVGESTAVERFFELLLNSIVFVPNRFQKSPLSNSPQYPNAFLDILGVVDGDRVIVPFFTRPEFIADWSGQEFSFRKLSASDFFSLIPDGWYADLNPGQEFGKEFSAWEISELKLGLEAIPTLVHEMNQGDDISQPIEVEFILPESKLPWMDSVIAFSEKRPEIKALYFLREIRKNIDDHIFHCFLIGVESSAQSAPEMELLRDEVQRIADQALIGAEPARCYIGSSRDESVGLGLFKNCPPLYTK